MPVLPEVIPTDLANNSLNNSLNGASNGVKFTLGNQSGSKSYKDDSHSDSPTDSSACTSPDNSRPNSPTNLQKQKRYVPLINRIVKRQQSRTPFFSLEFFPPRTQSGAINLISRYPNILPVFVFQFK